MDPEWLSAGGNLWFKLGKIGGLVDIDFSTRKGE